jgi:hypothetical protein
MYETELSRAVDAVMSVASSVGLAAEDAIVLNNSNKLTLRLVPCDVLARVAPRGQECAQFEVDLAQRLVASGCPVADLDPRAEARVYESDGFAITLWTYYEQLPSHQVSAVDYARALADLHAGMRTVKVSTPHFTDRVDSALELVASRDRTPELVDADRELLGETLRRLRRVIGERGGDQLLHGEPHPGNILHTTNGLIFTIWRPVAVARSSSTSPMPLRRSLSTIRVSILTCCAIAGS